MKKVKILIISYFFPPCSTGAATVMYNLCKYLPKTSFSIITAKSDLAIHLGIYDKEYILDCKTTRLPIYKNTSFDHLRFLLLAIIAGLFSNRNKQAGCILAVYPYFSDLLAGYVLHKMTKKPLVIYMHDLCSETRRKALGYKFLFFLEKKIFSAAATILVMNKKYRAHYLRRGINNLTIFPPSIDLSEAQDYERFVTFGNDNEGKLKIVFTGSVYKTNEDAVLAFLKAAKKAKDVQVLFATPTKEGYLPSHLKSAIEKVNVGFLSKKKCLELQKTADVLFLPLSCNYPYPEEMECAFPCKLLEYLAAGKSILAMVPRKSFVESFIREYEVGITITDLSIDRIVEAIEELRDEEKREIYSRNALKTISLFDAKKQSERFLSIFENIVSLDN